MEKDNQLTENEVQFQFSPQTLGNAVQHDEQKGANWAGRRCPINDRGVERGIMNSSF